MAALTATTVDRSVAGNKRVVMASLPAASNGDTWDSGLAAITAASIDFNDASAVAADSIAYTISGGVFTFAVAGTARATQIIAWGR